MTGTACTAGSTACTCPVLWMHGTADQVYSVRNAEDEISRFGNAAEPSSGSSKAVSTS